ncbi:copper resistance CopC family protein [Phenylobacterium sp.]|uniref:copper resistance CopC family protein n=1 Tax=Phenylobacterium sp. TaxID=1871053 RepID=UPI003D2C759B
MTRLTLAAALAATLLGGPAAAHTALAGSTPASGSILAASPKEIVLTFKEPTRVASVSVEAGGQPERRLTVATKGAARSVVIAEPRLAPGRNAVRWRAVSADGHAVSGEILIVIRPATR